jgi:hypothetical protein
MAANTSRSSASANVKIISRIFPRSASLNGSGPKSASIRSKDSILFPIGVFLLGLTLAKSQLLLWDTERIRLFYISTTIGTPPKFYLGVLQFNPDRGLASASLNIDSNCDIRK